MPKRFTGGPRRPLADSVWHCLLSSSVICASHHYTLPAGHRSLLAGVIQWILVFLCWQPCKLFLYAPIYFLNLSTLSHNNVIVYLGRSHQWVVVIFITLTSSL